MAENVDKKNIKIMGYGMIIRLKSHSTKISKEKVWLILYLFILVFTPPVIPKIKIFHVLTFYSVFAIGIKYKMYVKEFLKQANVKAFIKGMGIYFLYVVIAEILSWTFEPVENSAYLYVTYKLICTYIEIPICCCYLYAYCRQRKIKFVEIVYALIHIGIIQLVIGGIMMLSPTIKQFLVSLMQTNNNGSMDDISFWEYNRRYFAFSGCMLDMFGWGFGIIAGLPFYIKKVKLKYLIISPFLLVIGIMNSTTTVIIYLVMLAGGAAKMIIDEHKIKKIYLLLIGIIPLVFGLGFQVMRLYAADSFKWFLNEIMAMLGDSNKGSFTNVIDKRVWYLPESTIARVFGTGHYVYAVKGFKHSDIGYINMIWIAGILGTLILFVTLLSITRKCCEINRTYSYLFVIVFILFWVFAIKGIGIGINPGMACTLVIYLLASVSKENENLYPERVLF